MSHLKLTRLCIKFGRFFHNNICNNMPEGSSIVKSQSDSKEYRLISLNNGLRALLISDLKVNETSNVAPFASGLPGKCCETESDDESSGLDESDTTEDSISGEEDNISDVSSHEEQDEPRRKKKPVEKQHKQAAAALCINVGSFSDPDNIPGLAHFLEHMVFMGSEKYPDENKFDAFIRLHGGSDNACTDTERTVFHFEIQPNYFNQALDIWAQFFVAPLLKKDSVNREVKAVDSEFDMALNADDCRKEQLLSSLFTNDHPMGKFMWGNKLSLTDKPAEMGIDVYSALKEFHKTYYSPRFMTLALQSPETLDTLENWAREIFENIEHNEQTLPKFSQNIPNITPFQVVKILPVRNIQELSLTWVLPPQQKFYKTKPLHYVSWLVGHEGKGSVLSLLKQKNLALDLCGGNQETGYEQNGTCSLFNITVTLTDLGYSKYCEVIDIIFQYLAMLRNEGSCERIFREIQKIEQIDFTFQEEETPSDNVVKQCGNVLLYPKKDILTGDNLLFEYEPDHINSALDAMKPDSCIVFLSSPSHKNMSNVIKEKWFGSEHIIENIPDQWCKKWSQDSKSLDINSCLHLPFPNSFIAENFDLKTGVTSVESHQKYPQLISGDDAGYKLWFRQDKFFNLPKAYIRIHLVNPLSLQTPLDSVALEILVHLLIYNLAEVAYAADAASLTYGAQVGEDGGLILKFSGYNDKLPLLVDTVADYFVGFKTSKSDYNQRILQHTRTYYNTLIKPGKLAKSLRLSMLTKFGWSTVDKYKACQGLTFEYFMNFVKKFISSLYIESLVQGNFTEEEATSLVDGFVNKVNCSKLSSSQIMHQRVTNLEASPKICKVKALNPTDDNSMVVAYYQLGQGDVRLGAFLRLLETVMDEPCFDILRTKQQLGYSVYVQQHDTSGILGLTVNVATQNSKFSVESTSSSIVHFVTEEMADIVDKMLPEDFRAQVDALIAILKNEDTHLGEEVDRNWNEILSHNYLFDRVHQEIEFLEKCTQDELKTFYADLCVKNQKVIHVQVRGNSNEKKLFNGEKSGFVDTQEESQAELLSSPPLLSLEYLNPAAEEGSPDPPCFTGTYVKDTNKMKTNSSFYPVSNMVVK